MTLKYYEHEDGSGDCYGTSDEMIATIQRLRKACEAALNYLDLDMAPVELPNEIESAIASATKGRRK